MTMANVVIKVYYLGILYSVLFCPTAHVAVFLGNCSVLVHPVILLFYHSLASAVDKLLSLAQSQRGAVMMVTELG